MENTVTAIKAKADTRKLTREAHQLAYTYTLLARSCDQIIAKYPDILIEEHPELIEKLKAIKREVQDDAWVLRSATLYPTLEASLARIVPAKRQKHATLRAFLDKLRERSRARKKLTMRPAERASQREDK